MRPGDHERIPTVSEAVREATAIVDPEGTDTATLGLFESFEDDDRPATAAESEAVGRCAAPRPRLRVVQSTAATPRARRRLVLRPQTASR